MSSTFVKTASHQTLEVLARSGLDCVVIDAEHAPFSNDQLDRCMLASKAHDLPALVRVPNAQPSTLLQILDMGASGLLIPHALNAQSVRETVSSTLYVNGTRGFSNSPRAGGYGALSMNELMSSADQDLALIFQIEDKEAIEHIDALCAIERVDAYLIGRADLAVSLGVFDVNHPQIDQAIERVTESCQKHNKALGIFITEAQEAKKWLDKGIRFFIIGSDQSMLLKQAKSNTEIFHQIS
jgi:2-keto-3-deoxy-L-rhamnonate aldolase RhmA